MRGLFDPALSFANDPVSSAVARLGKYGTPDPHFDESPLANARVEAPVGGDHSRDSIEQCLVVLDRGDQQQRVGTAVVDRNVCNDAALGFLNLHRGAEFRWAM